MSCKIIKTDVIVQFNRITDGKKIIYIVILSVMTIQ